LEKSFKVFIGHFLHSELLRSTSVLISGTIIAQLIPILLQPVLRRFFSPETFGAYSVYSSIVGILIIVSSFKYESAICLPRKDKDSINILGLALMINIIFSLSLAAVVIIFKSPLKTLLNLPDEFSFMLYLVPLGTFLISSFNSFNFWLIRKKAFLAISINKLIRRSFEGVSQVIFALLKNYKGLLFGDIIGQISNVGAVVVQSKKEGFSVRDISYVKLKYVAGKYSEFPKYNLIPGFMSACSYLLPVILINTFYSAEYTGYFDLSKLVLSIPLALVASSISSVLLQRISERYQVNASFIKEIKPVFYIVSAVSILEILVISFFGVSLFKFIFGNNWGLSGEISRILVWSFALNFFVSSFSSVFISMRKIKVYSFWQVCYFLAIMSLFFFKGLAFFAFIKVYLTVEVICYSAAAIMMLIIVLRYEKKVELNHLAAE